jgi:hypothetical protein
LGGHEQLDHDQSASHDHDKGSESLLGGAIEP